MAQVNCEDCLKTYRPYSYGAAFMRVLMYRFSDWWEFEDEQFIREQLREHLSNPNGKQRLINKLRPYSMDDSFVEDFNFYCRYLENKRRKNISANFFCFDCEKYFCTKCVSKHSGHFTFSKDDKYDISKWDRIIVEMLDRLKAEGDQKRENMKREQIYLCDVVDVRYGLGELDLRYALQKLEQRLTYNTYLLEWQLDCLVRTSVEVLHILNDNKRWIALDDDNNYIKIFNVNNNKMTRYIKLSSPPHGITEIPSTDPSQSLIAVSLPQEKQITIMNINSSPAQVVSSINVQGECEDLAYCNNKIVTRCKDYLDGEWRHSIHVMKMSGEIINIINLHKFPGIKLGKFSMCRMSVHSDSKTIYVCHWRDPSCVISLSLDGQVLHSVTFTDLVPALIHVDKDRNVYVMEHYLPIYKLSADFRHREKIIDKDVGSIGYVKVFRFHNDKFYLASYEGHVYIIQHDSSRGHG